MKRSYRLWLNIFSIALLLFSLYLNFIKKERTDVFVPAAAHATSGLTHAPNTTTKSSHQTADGILVLR